MPRRTPLARGLLALACPVWLSLACPTPQASAQLAPIFVPNLPMPNAPGIRKPDVPAARQADLEAEARKAEAVLVAVLREVDYEGMTSGDTPQHRLALRYTSGESLKGRLPASGGINARLRAEDRPVLTPNQRVILLVRNDVAFFVCEATDERLTLLRTTLARRSPGPETQPAASANKPPTKSGSATGPITPPTTPAAAKDPVPTAHVALHNRLKLSIRPANPDLAPGDPITLSLQAEDLTGPVATGHPFAGHTLDAGATLRSLIIRLNGLDAARELKAKSPSASTAPLGVLPLTAVASLVVQVRGEHATLIDASGKPQGSIPLGTYPPLIVGEYRFTLEGQLVLRPSEAGAASVALPFRSTPMTIKVTQPGTRLKPMHEIEAAARAAVEAAAKTAGDGRTLERSPCLPTVTGPQGERIVRFLAVTDSALRGVTRHLYEVKVAADGSVRSVKTAALPNPPPADVWDAIWIELP